MELDQHTVQRAIFPVKMTAMDQMHQPRPRLFFLYHELRLQPAAYSYVLSTAEFERQADLVVRLRTEHGPPLLPEITFDDGHSSDFEIALPALHARGLRAWFFITVGWTGRRSGYMDWNQIRALQQEGQTIGAHGWSHALLTQCSEKELEIELTKAKLTLEDKLGAAVATMSLPGGRYNKHVLAACQEAGYTQVFTSVPRAEPQPAGFTLGRLNIRGDMPIDWMARLFEPRSGLLLSLQRQHHVKATAKRLLGDRLYEKVWARLNRQELDRAGEGAGGE